MEAKNSDQGFWARVCVRIHRPAYASHLYAYASRSMHMQTRPEEPKPTKQELKMKEQQIQQPCMFFNRKTK